MPTCRQIYDGSRPIYIFSVAPTAGSGDRLGRFRLQGDGSDRSSVYLATSGQAFEFRVIRNSGNIQLGLLGNGGGPTYWISSGNPVNWSPNGIQPGQMTYYQAPSAPQNVVITPGAGQISVAFTNPADNGGLALTQFRHQVSLRSDFATIVKEVTDTATPTVITGLPSGVVLYHRMLAENNVTSTLGKKGGAASATKSFTLGAAPATSPTITAGTPSADGKSISLSITPPTSSGGLAITNYTVDYTPVDGAGGSTGATHTATFTPGPNGVITGLNPGQRYKYVAKAVTSAGSSPASANFFVTQTRPTLLPGEYYDGASTALTDSTFAWSGTAQLSASQAKGYSVPGWLAFPTGTDASGATGVVHSLTGGFNRSRAARARFFSDATADGVVLGTAADPAAESVRYGARMSVRPTREQSMVMGLRYLDGSSAVLATELSTDVVDCPAGIWTNLTPIAGSLSPAGTASIQVIAVDSDSGDSWSLWLGGDALDMDSAIRVIGLVDTYFDGASGDTAQFTYAWTGPDDASTSTRTPAPVNTVDPLADPDCPAPPEPPRPPMILDDCIDETGTWRRYWVSIPATLIPEWASALPTLVMTTAGAAARQARIRTYPNPDGDDPTDVDPASYDSELIVSYLPANTQLTLDSAMQRAYASVAGASPIPADSLIYGTDNTPPVWPELSCGQAYVVSFDVPLDAPIGNLDTAVSLTRKII
jgi:hypothetical protein